MGTKHGMLVWAQQQNSSSFGCAAGKRINVKRTLSLSDDVRVQ